MLLVHFTAHGFESDLVSSGTSFYSSEVPKELTDMEHLTLGASSSVQDPASEEDYEDFKLALLRTMVAFS